MNRFMLRFGTILLTFTFGVGVNFLFNGFSSGIERWVERSDKIPQVPPVPTYTRPRDFNVWSHRCGLLVVTIGNDRSLWLRGEWMGSLDNPSPLLKKLNEVFARRAAARAYRAEFELQDASPLPADRNPQAVLINVPRIEVQREISNLEIAELISEIRSTGAEPVVQRPPQFIDE
jgi:hypothetical protein